MKVVAFIFALIACASAYLLAPAVTKSTQCPAPQPQRVASPQLFEALDLELDNPLIPDDKDIMPARKCGFCMG